MCPVRQPGRQKSTIQARDDRIGQSGSAVILSRLGSRSRMLRFASVSALRVGRDKLLLGSYTQIIKIVNASKRFKTAVILRGVRPISHCVTTFHGWRWTFLKKIPAKHVQGPERYQPSPTGHGKHVSLSQSPGGIVPMRPLLITSYLSLERFVLSATSGKLTTYRQIRPVFRRMRQYSIIEESACLPRRGQANSTTAHALVIDNFHAVVINICCI